MKKPVLIGMNNPLSTDPEHALYPYPPGSTGHRIWKMLKARTGVLRVEYLRTFDRRNLVESRTWNANKRFLMARANAMIPSLQGCTVVVFGNAVREAFGLPRHLVHPLESRGVLWRQLPHPSGRSLWYNDPGHVRVAELLLEELYREYKVFAGGGMMSGNEERTHGFQQ